jgi:hemerythrin superfamily protein
VRARPLEIHTALEEKIVYPAFRRAARRDRDRELVREAIDEHDRIDQLFPALKLFVASERTFEERLAQVRRAVEAHVEMEERELFPRARELFGPARLDVLGERVTREKQRLFERWNRRVGGTLRRAIRLVDKLVPGVARRRPGAARASSHAADPRG